MYFILTAHSEHALRINWKSGMGALSLLKEISFALKGMPIEIIV